mgnify:CR=1 FL=1
MKIVFENEFGTITEEHLGEMNIVRLFSGSLKKIEKDLLTIPSIRGTRYFGPSKMSFFNLLIFFIFDEITLSWIYIKVICVVFTIVF